MNRYDELLRHSLKIPELGHGGKSTYKYLINIIKQLPSNTAIVDIGPYMGSTTAFLSCGIFKFEKNIIIHAIDRWKADQGYNKKADKYNNIKLKRKSNFKKYFDENIKPFENKIITHRENILKFNSDKIKKPISLLVDDTGCFDIEKIIEKFENKFIPGKTFIFCMDYKFNERGGEFEIAKKYLDENKKYDLYCLCIDPSMCAIFRYIG